jgi:hypothetical protein
MNGPLKPEVSIKFIPVARSMRLINATHTQPVDWRGLKIIFSWSGDVILLSFDIGSFDDAIIGVNEKKLPRLRGSFGLSRWIVFYRLMPSALRMVFSMFLLLILSFIYLSMII